MRSKAGEARSSSEVPTGTAGGFFDRKLADEQGYDETGVLDKDVVARETEKARQAAKASGKAYSDEFEVAVEGSDGYEKGRSESRNSPHPLAGQDGTDDGKLYAENFNDAVDSAPKSKGGSGKIDPETANRIRSEAKQAALEQEKALGINSGMAGPGAYVAPTTNPKTLVTGQIPMTAEQAAMNNAVSQGMKLRSEMSTPFTKKLGAGLEGAVEKLKSRFPKYADKIDDGISSLQRKLDLDGSFADREQKQRDLALQAQQKLTDALNERAARINAGEKNIPEVDKRLLLDKEELAAITADEVRQQKEIQKESKRQNRQKLAGRAMTAGIVATTALGASSAAP
jgi:hypothetical protein